VICRQQPYPRKPSSQSRNTMSPDSSLHETSSEESDLGPSQFDEATQESLSSIAETFENMDRPNILQHQVDPLVAKTLLSELETEVMYKHVIDGELRHRAWRLKNTMSEALVEITVLDDDEFRTNFAKPPVGETFMDLRWWALNCHVNDREFVIDKVRNKELNDILHSSPPEWQSALSTLLYDSLGTANLVPTVK